MEEIWITINGFSNYEISNFGNVRNIRTGRILKKSLDSYGYGQVTLIKDKQPYPKRVRQLVADAFLEKPYNPYHECVLTNIDRDRSNDCVNNLKYITRAEAIQRSFRHGRKQTHIMRPIRCIETGEEYASITECSEATGISVQAISRSVNNKFLHTRSGYHFEPIETHLQRGR